MIFRVHLLPAMHGDAILVEFGSAARPDFILVDAGPKEAFEDVKAALRAILPKRKLRLLVVTHIDTDHIDGVVKLFGSDGLRLDVEEVWFNGWPQLEHLETPGEPEAGADEAEDRAAVHGEYLQVRLAKLPWNARFKGGAVVVCDSGALPRKDIPGGLSLTLLSPVAPKLESLKGAWRKAIAAMSPARRRGRTFEEILENDPQYREGDVVPDDMESTVASAERLDASVANGSSIALLAEFEGRRCALLADAHCDTVVGAMRRWCAEQRVEKVPLTAMKLSHHGSRKNISEELLDAMECGHFLVSTDGGRRPHPDKHTIDRIIRRKGAPSFYFNYLSKTTGCWGDPADQRARGYRAFYPEEGKAGITLDLMKLPRCP